jgi:cell wall-associated NlpC family hydrolase
MDDRRMMRSHRDGLPLQRVRQATLAVPRYERLMRKSAIQHCINAGELRRASSSRHLVSGVLVPLLVVTTTTFAYPASAQAMARHPRNQLGSHAPSHHVSRRSKHGEPVVSGSLPSTGRQNPRGDAALRFALAQVGKPYRWGATGPDAYDCSGLAQRAWRAAGVAIPRTSEAQSRFGHAVPLSQIEPGDLVIFYPNASHVGIYAGNGRVVAAPRPGELVGYADIRWMPVHSVRRPV